MTRILVVIIAIVFIGTGWVVYHNYQTEQQLKAECEIYMGYYHAKSVFGGYVPDECTYLNK